MVGSSQNIALSNIVLNTAVAKSFADFADVLESASDFEAEVDKLICETLKAHSRILFSGNSYSQEWEEEAAKRGLSNFKTSPEAYAHFDDEHNVALFERFNVMSRTEIRSRREIFFESYRKLKNIEARTMLEMTMRDYIPAVSAYLGRLSTEVSSLLGICPEALVKERVAHIDTLSNLLSETYNNYHALEAVENEAVAIACVEQAANYYKDTVIPAMDKLRASVDAMEVLCAREFWPVPTYGDMTFGV